MTRLLLLLAFLLSIQQIEAQYDTIVRYVIEDETTHFLVPALLIDTTKVHEHTPSMRSSGVNFTYLEDDIPENTFGDSDFTILQLASAYYNVSDYPVCTAVKLGYYSGDTLKPRCSGLLIANNLVLTAGHCVYGYQSGDPETRWKTPVIAFPAFDNGRENASYSSAAATDYFIFKSWYKRYNNWHDIAIIRLKYPIGIQTGWLGIGYNTDTSFLSDEIFHTLSYPGTTSWYDSTVYNGDSLYYKFGKLQRYDGPDFLEIGVPGVQGESGSSLFFTDNNSVAYSLGVLYWGGASRFYKITSENFPALKYIIEEYGSYNLSESDSLEQELHVYPVPLTRVLNIESPPLRKLRTIRIYNQFGQVVFIQNRLSTVSCEFDCTSLSAGLYFIVAELDNSRIVSKKVVKY